MATELTHHDEIELAAGDRWTIVGTLLNGDGSAFDLTSATVIWTMRGPDGEVCDDLVDASTVELLSPRTDGKIIITVPKTATAGRRAGRYHDAVRAFIDDTEADLMWRGPIAVAADPWELDT